MRQAPAGSRDPQVLLLAGVMLAWLGYGFISPMSAVSGQEPSIPQHPRELSFPALNYDPPAASDHRHVLSNGVAVYVVEDHELPLVDLSVFVRTGSYMESQDKPGLASLTGDQLRSGGTVRMSAAEFDEELDVLAARVNVHIGHTQGEASLNCLTKDLDRGLELFFEMLRTPGFQEDRLALAKTRITQRMRRRNDDPADIERREWRHLLRGMQHFSTRPGTASSLEAISREDLASFHQRSFRPRNFIIAVSGDVDTADILARLETHLSGWHGAATTVPIEAPTHRPRPGLYLVQKDDVNQGRVSLGHLGTSRDNPDRYALMLMNEILGGGGFAARLLARVRSDEGLAYSAGSSYDLGTYYDGTFRASFQSRSESVARATAIVLEEIRRIRTEPVDGQELEDAKAFFIGTFPRNFSSSAMTADLFTRDEYNGRDPDYWRTFRTRINAVSVADVLRVAEAYLQPERLVILVVGEIGDILQGDADQPQFDLQQCAPAERIQRIPLPDPLTMEYPPSDEPPHPAANTERQGTACG